MMICSRQKEQLSSRAVVVKKDAGEVEKGRKVATRF